MIARVHLLTPSMHPGDAVSHDVLGMRAWFLEQGLQVRVFAQFFDDALDDIVEPLEEYQEPMQDPEAILIYHHSIHWPEGFAYYSCSRNQRVLKYHGVTPAKYFEPYDPVLVDACRHGRRQLRPILRHPLKAIWSDSHSNARDLRSYSRQSYVVVPPFHHVPDLARLGSDDALAREIREDINFLFVGRIAPNKGHTHLIRAFAHYANRLRGSGRLIFAGRITSNLEGYRQMLLRDIARHGLVDRVLFTGQIDAVQLKTLYEHSHLFVCASEHEGFCVPLVEAMHFQLPIIGYATDAVAETLGDAGLTWDDPDPVILGECLRTVLSRPEVRDLIVQKQNERYQQHFAPEALACRFEAAWNQLHAEVTRDAGMDARTVCR